MAGQLTDRDILWIRRLLREGEVQAAIKIYAGVTACSYGDAKVAIERLFGHAVTNQEQTPQVAD